MEDRYLFRGKTKCVVGTYNFGKEDGEWVEGSLRWDCGKYTIYQFETDRADYTAYEVDPSTICQCTGYKGIFEHDIFQCNDGMYEITWSDTFLEWEAVSLNFGEEFPLGELYSDEIEVIGNRFDNSELLK